MKQSWYKGLDAQGTREIKAEYKAAVLMRKRLVLLLKEKIGDTLVSGRSKSGYDCPNWAYKQADMSGYLRAIDDIISMVEN